MFHGGPKVRLTAIITMGRRYKAAAKTFSVMYARPFDDEAVKVRAPASEKPMHTAMALCSLSTRTTWPFSISGRRAARCTRSAA
jgi:hypothetical protein